MILAIDPGKNKCGLAILDNQSKKVTAKEIVPTSQLSLRLTHYTIQEDIETIILGNGTHAKTIKTQLSKLNLTGKVVIVPEQFSTLEARKIYWQDHPPKGLMRLIPLSLRVPPRPIDDYAAIVIGQRFLTAKAI